MHPFGEMGPIDPTVTNDFNPVESATGRRLGISVEDVKAYVAFVKNTVGINHEDELVKTIEILANKIHPLALGNVERFLSQSRLVARKVLGTHMKGRDEHEINEIIENMASKLYFHGHPINRREAKEELKLEVNDELQPELEAAMWELYRHYENEFENTKLFRPADELMLQAFPLEADAQALQQPKIPCQVETKVTHAIIESDQLSSVYRSVRRYLLVGLGPNQEPLVREDTISEGWDHTPAQP